VENLNDAVPRYTALSYTWANASGDTSLSSIIMIQPTPGSTSLYEVDLLEVTENCEKALRRLRAAGYLTVWVDAVCVNQRSTRERTHQVGLMSRIYASAVRVFIYTGEDDVGQGPSGEYVLKMLSERGMAELDMRDDPSDQLDDGIMIDMFFQRPYFWRKWIIQEIALAQEATLACGSVEVPWGLISLQTSTSEAGATSIYHDQATLSSIAKNRRLRLLAPSANPPPWLSSLGRLGSRSPQELAKLLFETRRCQCSDERDRIFSLLGLQKTPDASGSLHPDYTLSVRHTFVGFAAWVMEKCGPEFLFLYRQSTQRQGQEKTREGLMMPSWVPLWDENTVRQASASTIRTWFPTKQLRSIGGMSEMCLNRYVILGPRELWPSGLTTPINFQNQDRAIIVHAGTGSLVIKQCHLLKVGAYTDTFHPILTGRNASTEPQRMDRMHRGRHAWRFFITLDADEHVIPAPKEAAFHPADVFAALPGLEVLLHLRPTDQDSYRLLGSGLLALRPPESGLGDPFPEYSPDLSPSLIHSGRTLHDFLKLYLWLSILEPRDLSWPVKRVKAILDSPKGISDSISQRLPSQLLISWYGSHLDPELGPFVAEEVVISSGATKTRTARPTDNTLRRLWNFDRDMNAIISELQARPCYVEYEFEASVEGVYWEKNTRLLKAWIQASDPAPSWAREQCDLARQAAAELLAHREIAGQGAANGDGLCVICALLQNPDTATACSRWEASLTSVTDHLCKLQSELSLYMSETDGQAYEKSSSMELRVRNTKGEMVGIASQSIADAANTISRASRDIDHECSASVPLDAALRYVERASDALWRLTSLVEEIARDPEGVMDIVSRGELHRKRAGRAGPRWRSGTADWRITAPTASKLPLVVRGLFKSGPVIIE
jgi:hypothetical protein